MAQGLAHTRRPLSIELQMRGRGGLFPWAGGGSGDNQSMPSIILLALEALAGCKCQPGTEAGLQSMTATKALLLTCKWQLTV